MSPSSAIFGTLFLLLSLGTAAAATFVSEPQQAAALWLSRQLHRPVEASQILVFPPDTALEGCTITRARHASIGATALSLRCPALALPHLVLLHLPADAASSTDQISETPSQDSPHGLDRFQSRCVPGVPHICRSQQMWVRRGSAYTNPATTIAVKFPPIVRAGAALRADWRTASLHAQLPVVALDSGASGAEIRVRIVNTNRVLRARILSAQDVAILVAGA
jgi:hypothetical protein